MHCLIGALCNAAYDNGKLAEVAEYAKMDEVAVQEFGEFLKKFGSEYSYFVMHSNIDTHNYVSRKPV